VIPKTIGVIGLGLLGRGITATLVAHGFHTIAYDHSESTRDPAMQHILGAINETVEHGWLTQQQAEDNLKRLRYADRLEALNVCDFIIESIVEDLTAKTALFNALEPILSPETVIGTNTSALPITLIQQGRTHPGRFVGMHWGEPCHISRFQEVIRGELTTDAAFDTAVGLSYACGKEPSLVQKDVRGFITNRLMYAMLREALHLLDSGVADVETIDRSFRNDMGFWATIAGPFRWMDLTGIPAYASVMKDLFPELSNNTQLPDTMQRMLDEGAEGVGNLKGFYDYDSESAQQWVKNWTRFTWRVRELADDHVPTERPEALC
jgi:3-hydroxyacyl-CoA dehydrogenase